MIPARDARGVFCLDPAKGTYVAIEIFAFSDDGAPMVLDIPKGLVDAREHPNWLGVLPRKPEEFGSDYDAGERWFRKVFRLAADAPINRRRTEFGGTAPTFPQPGVPKEAPLIERVEFLSEVDDG